MIQIPPMAELLLNAGYSDGWALNDDQLIIWEHEDEPPAPLVRPTTEP